MTGGGIDAVRNAGADPHAAPDFGDSEDTRGDSWDACPLGQDCPVVPLGVLKKTMYFLDWQGQLVDLSPRCEKGELMLLFGPYAKWLEGRWPQWKSGGANQPPIPDGFNQKKAQEGLILACSMRRIFNPSGRERGRGAHRGDNGELVLHCGEQLVISGARMHGQPLPPKIERAGRLYDRYVYSTFEALPVPADKAAPTETALALVQMLDTWNWKDKRPSPIETWKDGESVVSTVSITSYLLMCWLAAATLGGALKHRPHVWITGPSGAGKTTLQQLLRDLMNDWGVFIEDATEAGVRQMLDQDTLPVMFDEIEPDEGNSDVHHKIVKLARLSYSGGEAIRGQQDHKSKTFVARSCFLFSSILHHELPAQDRNRMAVLHLAEFPPKTAPLEIPEAVKDWSLTLRRRLVEQWHRYDATQQVYARQMLAQGYAGREQDTYATLLAAGDLLLYDKTPDPDVMHEINRVRELVSALSQVIDKARSEAESTTDRCVGRLTSFRLPAKSGQDQRTVGEWIEHGLIDALAGIEDSHAKAKLKTHGMRLINLAPDHATGNGEGGLQDLYLAKGGYLAVANKSNVSMSEIFERSDWKGGKWSQALISMPDAIGNKKSRFGGKAERCVLVPIAVLVDIGAAEKAADAKAAKLFEELGGAQR